MRHALIAIVLIFASAADAQTAADRAAQAALDLGSALGAERPCGLTYDPAKVSSFIKSRIPPGDAYIAGAMTTASSATKAQIGEMSATEKLAYCQVMERSARASGLLD